jgi:hypothetical protein
MMHLNFTDPFRKYLAHLKGNKSAKFMKLAPQSISNLSYYFSSLWSRDLFSKIIIF